MINNEIKKKSILLVEDEALIAIFESRELEEFGYKVTHVTNGQEAIRLALDNKKKFDLILMDIDLGHGIDGTEVAEEILKQKNIPIVFLSSHTEPEIVTKTEKITSYGYVVKNSGIVVLDASIKMAFKLYEANRKNEIEKMVLRDVFESTLSGYWDWDLINNTEYLSPTFKKMFGYEDHELPNSPDTWQKLIFQEDLPGVFEVFNKHIQSKGKTPFYNEVRYHHKNSSTVWVIYAGRVIEWKNDGTPIRMVGCHIDITAQKNIENRLSDELQKINNILTSIPSGLYIYRYIEPDKLYLESGNEETEKLTGIKVSDWIGKEFNEIWPNAKKDGITDRFLNVMKTGENIEIEDVHYQDERINSAFRIRVFKIPNNKLGVAFENITKIKISEQLVRDNEKKFHSLFDNINIGIALHEIIVDEQNNPVDYIWLDCNPAYENMTSLNRSNIIGRRGLEIIPSLEKKWINAYGKVALTGESVIIIDHSQYLDRYWEVYAYSTEYKIFTIAMQDITERKKSEDLINKLSSRQNDILAAIPDIIAEVDNNKIYTWLNKPGLDFFGDDALGKEASYYFEGNQDTYITVQPLFNGDPNIIYVESWQRRKDGEKRLLAWWCRVRKDINGNVIGALSTARDITETKKSEEQIQQQLSEKEVLLKEIHHRIKNNIISIKNLLLIQSESIKNDEALKIIQDAIGRVECMQKVYESLLISEKYTELTVKSYIENLTASIVLIFPEKDKVTVKFDIDNIVLNINKLIFLGIILNELITNSMKYAFINRESGIIDIAIKQEENNITFLYHDNGNGLPDNFKINETEFGFKLIKMLTQQLNGSFEMENKNGFGCIIRFKV